MTTPREWTDEELMISKKPFPDFGLCLLVRQLKNCIQELGPEKEKLRTEAQALVNAVADSPCNREYILVKIKDLKQALED